MNRRRKNGKKEWMCDMCNQWFEVDEEWDKKGAKEECKELWGIEPDDDSPFMSLPPTTQCLREFFIIEY